MYPPRDSSTAATHWGMFSSNFVEVPLADIFPASTSAAQSSGKEVGGGFLLQNALSK